MLVNDAVHLGVGKLSRVVFSITAHKHLTEGGGGGGKRGGEGRGGEGGREGRGGEGGGV